MKKRRKPKTKHIKKNTYKREVKGRNDEKKEEKNNNTTRQKSKSMKRHGQQEKKRRKEETKRRVMTRGREGFETVASLSIPVFRPMAILYITQLPYTIIISYTFSWESISPYIVTAIYLMYITYIFVSGFLSVFLLSNNGRENYFRLAEQKKRRKRRKKTKRIFLREKKKNYKKSRYIENEISKKRTRESLKDEDSLAYDR